MSATWSAAPLVRQQPAASTAVADRPVGLSVGGEGSAPVDSSPPASHVERVADAMKTELRQHPWTFTLITGDLETAEDFAALDQLNQVATMSRCLLMSQGHGDQTTWMFGEDGGRAACMAMHAIALTAGRSWWRCQTRFGGDQ